MYIIVCRAQKNRKIHKDIINPKDKIMTKPINNRDMYKVCCIRMIKKNRSLPFHI